MSNSLTTSSKTALWMLAAASLTIVMAIAFRDKGFAAIGIVMVGALTTGILACTFLVLLISERSKSQAIGRRAIPVWLYVGIPLLLLILYVLQTFFAKSN